MKRILIGIACAMLVSSVPAHQGPASSAGPFSLELGSEFVTVQATCGTPFNPTCPGFTEPVGRPFLIHYVTVGGRADQVCSGTPAISREMSDGINQVFNLGRLVLNGDNQDGAGRFSWDNTVITFPKPLRGHAGDRLGVQRTPQTLADPEGACGIIATFGIEYLK